MITRLGITSIFVTHDQDEAIEVADDIIVTNEGRIEQSGSATELYSKPKTPFVVRFIGNSVPIDNYNEFRSFENAGENKLGILRPEFVDVYKAGESVKFAKSADEGIVRDIIFRGSSIEIKVEVHNRILSSVRSINDAPVEIGEKVLVFVYRMFLVDGNEVKLVENSSLKENSIII